MDSEKQPISNQQSLPEDAEKEITQRFVNQLKKIFKKFATTINEFQNISQCFLYHNEAKVLLNVKLCQINMEARWNCCQIHLQWLPSH